MRQLRTARAVISSIVCAASLSCGGYVPFSSGSVKSYLNRKGAIPSNFGAGHEVLMVLRLDSPSDTLNNQFDEYLRKTFSEYCGRYVIVHPRRTHRPLYGDANTYRFIFGNTGIGRKSIGGSSNSFSTIDFFIGDRKEGKRYASTLGGTPFAHFEAAVKAYTQSLNAKLNLPHRVGESGVCPPREGEYTFYYPTGEKAAVDHYKNNKREGVQTEWYLNGQKKMESTYRDGELDGLTVLWGEDGAKVKEITYTGGDLEW